MKAQIHPTYNDETTIKCACGATYKTGSTQKDILVEVCSHCHPFYTGKQRIIDTARRIDKFAKRMEQQTALKDVRKGKKAKQATRKLKKAGEEKAKEEKAPEAQAAA